MKKNNVKTTKNGLMAILFGFLAIPAGGLLIGSLFMVLAFNLGNYIGYVSLEAGSAIDMFVMENYLLIAISGTVVTFYWQSTRESSKNKNDDQSKASA